VTLPPLETDLAATIRNVERQLIVDALERADGVQRKAARLLGVTERVLWYKIKETPDRRWRRNSPGRAGRC